MMNNYIINLISIVFINVVLYLSINFSELFLHLLVTFFYFLVFVILKKINKLQSVDNTEKDNKFNSLSEETADDHPIIKSARKRLGK